MKEQRNALIDIIPFACLAASFALNMFLAVRLDQKSAALFTLQSQIHHSSYLASADLQELTTKDPPAEGMQNAPVTIVLFSDFECPYCRHFYVKLARLSPSQKAHLRIVFHQFPLPFHKNAERAAEISVCAGLQSNAAFWRAYNYLFTSPPDQMFTNALQHLEQDPLIDGGTLESCISSRQAQENVRRDVELGRRYGVQGTPTMFINGRRLTGSREDIGALIDLAYIHQ